VRTLAYTHRSGKLAFDEKAGIDIRDMLDDFEDCLEESLNENEVASDVDSPNEYSQPSYGKEYTSAGAGTLFAAAGLKSFSGMLENVWGDDNAVDADDVKASMHLGSDVHNASTPVQSTSSGFGTAGTPVTPPLPPGVETAA
jgi:hypothetical protein